MSAGVVLNFLKSGLQGLGALGKAGATGRKVTVTAKGLKTARAARTAGKAVKGAKKAKGAQALLQQAKLEAGKRGGALQQTFTGMSHQQQLATTAVGATAAGVVGTKMVG